jgi:hypothetical protein
MEVHSEPVTGPPLVFSGDETKPDPTDFLEVLEEKTEVNR